MSHTERREKYGHSNSDRMAISGVATAKAAPLAAREAGGATFARGRAQREAAAAMQHAARWLSVEPSELRAADYRAFRAAQDELALPSVLRISVLFAGWQRAREQVGLLTRDEVAVEAHVVRTLYGDPICRRDAYGTSPGSPLGG
ncbi:MAG TPA: hypothetical protein VMI13_10395 [Solirubrobacteraceae bacterium]|nr:hypothetical protein [Solirubrobacteraceae bacterium]